MWVKKQGSRTTGGQRFGELGEAAFFGVLFLLGLASLVFFVTAQWYAPELAKFEWGVGFWLVMLVLISFVLLGGHGLAVTLLKLRTSQERRSALARDASQLNVLPDETELVERYPTVPRVTNLTNSPGIQFKYRLPIARTPAWAMLAAASFCLIWNGMTVVLMRQVWLGHRQDTPDWLSTIALVPFFAIGTWSILFLLRQIWQQTIIGPTLVEASDHPLSANAPFELHVSQSGRITLTEFSVHLICEEETTCHQGTDIRTDRQIVVNELLHRCEKIPLTAGDPLELKFNCQIPIGVMHSFQSAHNAVIWKIVVRGASQRGMSFEHPFPLVVIPSSPAETAHETSD